MNLENERFREGSGGQFSRVLADRNLQARFFPMIEGKRPDTNLCFHTKVYEKPSGLPIPEVKSGLNPSQNPSQNHCPLPLLD